MYDNNLSIVFRITLFELAAEAITTKNKKTSQTHQSERFLFIYSKRKLSGNNCSGNYNFLNF